MLLYEPRGALLEASRASQKPKFQIRLRSNGSYPTALKSCKLNAILEIERRFACSLFVANHLPG